MLLTQLPLIVVAHGRLFKGRTMSTLKVNNITNAAGTGLTDAGQVGVAQTWQTVTRTSGTTYTNTTGRPIMLTAYTVSTGSTSRVVSVSIDGVDRAISTVGSALGAGRAFISLIIPAGSTYVVTHTNLDVIHELR
jgi:hypothetical protein